MVKCNQLNLNLYTRLVIQIYDKFESNTYNILCNLLKESIYLEMEDIRFTLLLMQCEEFRK